MKKEVKLYKFAWTNSHNGRRYRENAEIELVETNAIETEKQYQIHHDHGNGNRDMGISGYVNHIYLSHFAFLITSSRLESKFICR